MKPRSLAIEPERELGSVGGHAEDVRSRASGLDRDLVESLPGQRLQRVGQLACRLSELPATRELSECRERSTLAFGP